MSMLESLSLIAAKKVVSNNPAQQRRAKLIGKLDEQIKLAEARMQGTDYTKTRLKIVQNAETGQATSVEVTKRMKEWWWLHNGKLLLSVRYGNKQLELGAKGKNAVEVADMAGVVTALQVIKQAVENGELDAAIEAAASKLRAGFKK